jgi:apolipoprotein N-acyltransferase
VSQDEKFAESRIPRTLAWLEQALRAAGGELVVAPETAMPLLPAQRAVLAPGWWEGLQAHFEAERRVALIGAPLGSYREGYTNSAVAMGPAPAASYRYDKVHLVPFGEFIPLGFRWFTNLMNIPLGDFTRGPLDAPSLSVGAERIAPNICYEDLFGEELARRFRDTVQAPTILVNLSNIAWFGDTVAVPQHLNISRMRTLELQRPMLRATNTGATAVIDHRGQVVASLPAWARGVLQASVQGREGMTPYAWWAGRFDLWPLVALALAVVAWRVAGARRLRGAGAAAQ